MYLQSFYKILKTEIKKFQNNSDKFGINSINSKLETLRLKFFANLYQFVQKTYSLSKSLRILPKFVGNFISILVTKKSDFCLFQRKFMQSLDQINRKTNWNPRIFRIIVFYFFGRKKPKVNFNPNKLSSCLFLKKYM